MQHSYNYQIDFLRAIAVLLVVFNHLNISLFQGGFIGVDIFLVISGYLITKNIIKEQNETSPFSLKKFYERRVIRLAPAFFTVISICFVVFGLTLTSSEWTLFLESLISSVSLSSNIYFSTQLNDYFSINAYSTPLLHIWSLSLEEQFYLIWPFALLIIYRTSKKNYLLFFSFFTIVSFICSEFLTRNSPIFAYYLLPSRIFEFCIGAIIVVLPHYKASKKASLFWISISIVIIFIASYFFNKQIKFPTYNALIPCLSAAIFIYFSQNIEKINTLNPIYYLGKISYPMYLWHWPIIVYLSLYSISFTPLICILVILFTIVFSSLTHEVIEKGVKVYSITSNQNIKLFFILPVCLITLITLFLLNKNKIQLNNNTDTSNNISIKCIDKREHPIEECFFGLPTKDNIDVLLVGDSHANSLSGFVDVITKDAGLRGYELTQSATLFMPYLNLQKTVNNKSMIISNFRNHNSSVAEHIKNSSYKFIIFSGAFPAAKKENTYLNNENKKKFIEGIQSAIELSIQNNAIPILINDTPSLENIDINCNLRNIDINQCRYSSNIYKKNTKDWRLDLDTLQIQYQNLIVINLNDLICRDIYCYSYINQTPLYRDSQHITYAGSKEMAIEYLKKNANPLNQN